MERPGEENTMSEGEYYQHNKIPIKVGGAKQAEVIQKMQEYLNNIYEEYTKHGVRPSDYNSNNIGRYQRKNVEISGTVLINAFDIEHEDNEKMIGAGHIIFSNGFQSKILTLSGEFPISSHQQFIPDPNNKSKSTLKSVPMKKEINGYEFINMGTPEGLIMDLSSGEDTTVKFNGSCAAQKIVKYASEYLKSHPGVTVNEIYMRETFWCAPRCERTNRSYSRLSTVAVTSCRKCKVALKYATGGRPEQEK